MLTIQFRKGDIFHEGIQLCDVIAIIGHYGMDFRRDYTEFMGQYPASEAISNPFEEQHFQLIPYGNKYLCCIKGERMSDDECKTTIDRLLSLISQKNLRSVAFTGVRVAENNVELDNLRVRFTVDRIVDWYEENRKGTTLEKVLLIARSDNFTRNYQNDIIVEP